MNFKQVIRGLTPEVKKINKITSNLITFPTLEKLKAEALNENSDY